MRLTKAVLKEYSDTIGLTPVQIDGIPEGFSFREPNLTIGNKEHIGKFVSYIPLKDWDDAVYSTNMVDLLALYKKATK